VTARRPRVVLLMRRAHPGYHSIERLFEWIEPHLSERFTVRIVRVPCGSGGLLGCARNLAFTARQRADVVHVTGDIQYCALAVRRRKCILTIHDLGSLGRLTGIRKRLFALLWYALPVRWAGQVTVISAETGRQLARCFPASAGKAEIIPNGVGDAFRDSYRATWTRTGKLRVLQVGTGPNKNLERVAAATAGLPARLRIIGTLSDEQRSLLDALDLEWSSAADLPADELVGEYRDSDVLVFASTYEGFGLPVAEAQAIGLPVITSAIAPMTDVAGDGALLVDPNDVRKIRSGLERLIASPELGRRLSEAGRRNVERFGTRAVADRYAAVYERAIRPSWPRRSGSG
jgi:glycosyltransferase involved in cell wall biosynthesis